MKYKYTVLVEAEEAEVLADRGHEAAVHALGLQAQHHDDVAILEALFHVDEGLGPERLNLRGQEGRRCGSWRSTASAGR